jgi:hypothetical protein
MSPWPQTSHCSKAGITDDRKLNPEVSSSLLYPLYLLLFLSKLFLNLLGLDRHWHSMTPKVYFMQKYSIIIIIIIIINGFSMLMNGA